jgi:hypothetical protein
MNQIANAQLLKDLRDIHLPQEIGFFPSTVGWWLIPAFFALMFLAFRFYKFYKIHSVKINALSDIAFLESKDEDIAQNALELSLILKRVAIVKLGREKVAALYGKDWVNFLRKNSKNETDFDDDEKKLIMQASYAPEISNENAIKTYKKLINSAYNWVRKNT